MLHVKHRHVLMNDDLQPRWRNDVHQVHQLVAVHVVCCGHSLHAALQEASRHDGMSVVHVPVYAGPAEAGGLGAYGSWNVGNWCDDVQRRYFATMI